MLTNDPVDSLKRAIVNLVNAKLHDALATPGGLMRLVANRTTGVASPDVRNAEKQLGQALSRMVAHCSSARTGEADRADECVGAVRSALGH